MGAMPRARRIDLPAATHHVVNRGVDRRTIFFDDRDRVAFGRLIGEASERFGISIVAYCLMDNHYHLIVHCPDAVLSASMQFVGSRYAEFVNARHGRTGHLFGARFHSSYIDSDLYQLATLRYVERNSLDLPGVTSPEEYRWSSVRAHLELRTGPAWLDSAKVRGWFASVDAYRDFILRDITTTEPVVLRLDHAEAVATLMVDTYVDDVVSPIKLERTVLLGLSQRLGPDNQQRVFDRLALTSTRSVRDAVRRADRRIQAHPTINGAVDGAQRWLFDISSNDDQAAA